MECYKYVGETTSEFASRIRQIHHISPSEKIAICGKLDPQAEGRTTVLIGDNTKYMSKYLQSNKTYEFFIVIGIATSSDDIMGRITETTRDIEDKIEIIEEFMETNIKNQKIQNYHPISAKKIRKGLGKKRPLWYWHKKGVLQDDDLPSKEINVYSLKETEPPLVMYFKKYMIMVRNRLDKITDKKTFNIEQILTDWNKIDLDKIILLSYQIKVSTGFYVRMISKDIRDKLNIPVHIFAIKRLKVE